MSRIVTLAVPVVMADGASVSGVTARMREACARMAAAGVIGAREPQVLVLQRDDARRGWRTVRGLAHDLLALPLDAAVELSVSAGGSRVRRGLCGIGTDLRDVHASGIVVLSDFDMP